MNIRPIEWKIVQMKDCKPVYRAVVGPVTVGYVARSVPHGDRIAHTWLSTLPNVDPSCASGQRATIEECMQRVEDITENWFSHVIEGE